MSSFEVLVEKVDDVSDHPNADRLSLIKIRNFHCVSAKLESGEHRYSVGDFVVYVPEGSIVPENLLRMGFWNEEKNHGLLGGSNHNRVVPVKLRGALSQGIIFPSSILEKENIILHKNVSEILGITKYEPIIPLNMSGDVSFIGKEHFVTFDLENIKKYYDVFEDGEEVIMTEKLHGTQFGSGILVNTEIEDKNLLIQNGHTLIAFSKGLGSTGIVFKDNETNLRNIYMIALKKLTPSLIKLAEHFQTNVYVFSEILGVQDLQYDGKTTNDFASFSIYVGKPHAGRWLDWNEFTKVTSENLIPIVPVIYRGPFNQEVLEIHTKGSTVYGNGKHIREGVVILPVKERFDPRFGRVQLKSISEDYLLRKNKNATEFA